MKHVFLTLLALLGFHASRAQTQQLPNAGLETWTTVGGVERPTNWLTSDDLLGSLFGVPFPTGTTTKTTDAFAGTYAAKLQTVDVPPFGPVPATLALGNKLGLGLGGLPFASRPSALQLHYKSAGANFEADSLIVVVFLMKHVNGHSEPIAYGGTALTASAAYRQLSIPIDYDPTSPAAPDSIVVAIQPGHSRQTLGTTLYVDNFTLVYTATPTRPVLAAPELTIYPNPSTDGLFALQAPQDPAWRQASLTVRDITGRVVCAQPAMLTPGVRNVDLRGQPAGVYTLQLSSAQGTTTRRLVIR